MKAEAEIYLKQQAGLISLAWPHSVVGFETFSVGITFICKTSSSLDFVLPAAIASFHSSSVHPCLYIHHTNESASAIYWGGGGGVYSYIDVLSEIFLNQLFLKVVFKDLQKYNQHLHPSTEKQWVLQRNHGLFL